MLDEFLMDVGAIQQEHVSKGVPILVEAVGLEETSFPKPKSDAAHSPYICPVG